MILAVETATRTMSVALLRGESLVAEITTCDDRVHSERLLPAIDELLGDASTSLDAVTAFAVSAGPGSFTGLRIGIATVKGLAFGGEQRVAPVSTLAALAEPALGEAGAVAALLDARRGEVYAAVFGEGGAGPPGSAGDRVYRPDELCAVLPEGCRLVVGEGAEAVAEAVARQRDDTRWLEPPLGEPRAHWVGRLGARVLERGDGVAADALRPRYVRRAEAEVKRTGERFEAV